MPLLLAKLLQDSSLHDDAVDAVNPTECDVLCGSSQIILNHPGNVRFHATIMKRLDDYCRADTKVKKARLTKETYCSVIAEGGRFLKKHPIYDLWFVAKNQQRVGRDKISHSLRMLVKRRRSFHHQIGPHEDKLDHWHNARSCHNRYKDYDEDEEDNETGSLYKEEDETEWKALLQEAACECDHDHKANCSGEKDGRMIQDCFSSAIVKEAHISSSSSRAISLCLSEAFRVRTIEEMMIDSAVAEDFVVVNDRDLDGLRASVVADIVPGG